MASRNIQDAFTDDSDESCPLCVEEFDLSDKNFRPCPCGYQVCQFCYNNIKNNVNGLCPACRRPYDDQSIEWKIVSPEEQKADIELQARKKAAARKKETERKQVETNNRKNLAGLRVIQKNLVYVIGLTQKSNEEDFLQTLRGDQYFGQYGRIIKIVVSKAKEGSHNNNTVGVYVTFERREDAAKCIAAVDGSKNLDRPLRAQYGTTKYCSAYLRNEQCQNRSCTFLHEAGEDHDSFSRQDLSSMNAMSSQRNAQPSTSSSSSRPLAPPSQPLPQQIPQSISSASHSAFQSFSRDEPASQNDGADGPALPSHATWATRNAATESLRSSKAPSVSTPSPVVSQATIAVPDPGQSQQDSQRPAQPSTIEARVVRRSARPKSPFSLERAMKIFTTSSYNLVFDRSAWPEDELRLIDAYPPLFAPNGGHVRLRQEKEAARQRQQQQEDRNVIGAMSATEEDDNPASGSFQLGGEPDTQVEPSETSGRMSGQRQSSFAQSPTNFPFGGAPFQQSAAAAKLPRTLTPQQQQQLALLRSSASSRQSQINHSQFQQGYGQNTSSLHGQQQSNPFQMQVQGQSFGSTQGHTRQASRFTFANDTASASTAVKPAANPQLMAQQSAMMPPNHNKHFQQSNPQNNHFFSGVQGPPPGLKSSGTPPISGGGMFGQGHGFASAMGGSAGFNGNATSKNTNDELMRDLLRSRNGSLNGQGSDLGKHSPVASLDPDSVTGLSLDNPARDNLRSISSTSFGPPQPSSPAIVPPGLSSAQDFPPLAAPSQPPPPVAPKYHRNVTGKTTTTSIKPVVPVISATVPAKSSSKTPQTLTNQTASESNEAKSVDKETFEPEIGSHPEHAEAKQTENKLESTNMEISSQVLTMEGLSALRLGEKKGKPEKLDLGSVKEDLDQRKASASNQQKPTSVKVEQKSLEQTVTIPVDSSASISARKAQARTLQATETSKDEAPSPGVIPPQPKEETSRRPSVTSLNRPETPLSEKISDNLSYTSASISRTNSPPSRVGSAPTRRVTKSQQKKERQERAKKVDDVTSQKEETVSRSEGPVVQAPIIGRKKKTKKSKEKSGATADSTPTVTRPPSPEVSESIAKETTSSKQTGDVGKGTKESNKQIKLPPISSLDPETSPGVPALPSVPESDQTTFAQSTVTAIFAGLRASGDLPAHVIDGLFKPITSASHRLEQNLDPQVILNSKFDNLKLDQIARLDNDDPVVMAIDRNNAVLIMPNRRYLKGLSPAQANRYRQLYLQGARTSVSSSPKQVQDLLDPLMPLLDLSGEGTPVPVVGPTDLKTTTQLNNRFAEPLTPQVRPPASSLARLDASGSKLSLSRGDKLDMGLEEAESALTAERKNTEALEKRLNALIRKNRRLVLGSGN